MLPARLLRSARASRIVGVKQWSSRTNVSLTYSSVAPAFFNRILYTPFQDRGTHTFASKGELPPELLSQSQIVHAYQLRSLPTSSYPQSALVSSIESKDQNRQRTVLSRNVFAPNPTTVTLYGSSPVGRKFVTGRLHSGIDKQRSIRKRCFSSSSQPPSTSNATKPATETGKDAKLSWRDALKSPRKAMKYSVQLTWAVIDWAKHIWAGAKLLAADVRVSSKIVKKITHGKQISRRERNFIVQTGVDLARLVPFSLFLVIPLAEFALPFALRLFPHMLPSQFQDQMKADEDLKRRLKARLELAKYLRDVVEEKAKTVKGSDASSVSSVQLISKQRFESAISKPTQLRLC